MILDDEHARHRSILYGLHPPPARTGFDKLVRMRPVRHGLALASAASLAVVALSAQGAPVDVRSLGPRVGDAVTDFHLVDAEGREQSLRSAAGPKGTMLVFFRSADW
jgi:hypothetical protein